jgi:hypothetical protein
MRDNTSADLRAKLRLAIGKRRECERQLKSAEQRLQHATKLLNDREAALDTYADIETLVAAHRAEAEKAWAATAADAPRAPLPAQLIEQIRQRDALTDDVAAAKSGKQLLEGDRDRARNVLSAAERKTNIAAAAILIEYAQTEAAILKQLKQQAWHYEARLRGLARLWVPSGTLEQLGPIALGRAVIEALDLQPPQTAPNKAPETLMAAKWRAYHANLTVNADSQFNGGANNHEPQAA